MKKIKFLVATVLLLTPALVWADKPDPSPNPPLSVSVDNTPDVNVVNTADVNVTNTPDVNVANSVQLGDLIPITYSTWTANLPASLYDEIPPGYLHSLSLTVSTVDPVGTDHCYAQAVITFLEAGNWDVVVSRTRLMTVATAAGSASNAHDFTSPIAVIFNPDDYAVVLEVLVNGAATNGCYVGLGGIYEEAAQ